MDVVLDFRHGSIHVEQHVVLSGRAIHQPALRGRSWSNAHRQGKAMLMDPTKFIRFTLSSRLLSLEATRPVSFCFCHAFRFDSRENIFLPGKNERRTERTGSTNSRGFAPFSPHALVFCIWCNQLPREVMGGSPEIGHSDKLVAFWQIVAWLRHTLVREDVTFEVRAPRRVTWRTTHVSMLFKSLKTSPCAGR